jgi:hypothetical protein
MLHDEELHNSYPFPDVISSIKSRRIRRSRHIARMEELRNVYKILVGQPKKKKPL